MFWITLLFGTVLSFVVMDRQPRPVFEIRLAKKGSREGHANYAVILVITSESDDAVFTRVSSIVTVSCGWLAGWLTAGRAEHIAVSHV